MGVANISGNILTDSGASLSSYLPLTGGTLTGALSGTSATFSSFVQGDYFQTGSNPATSGGVRLGTQVAIRARNVANTANIPLIESTSTDAVSIASGGANVGIGITSPGTKLHVFGVGTTYAQIQGTAGNTTGLLTNNNSRTYFTGTYYNITDAWEVADITAGGLTRLAVTSNGYLWVNGAISGFTASGVQMQVNGQSRLGGDVLLHNGSNVAQAVRLSCNGADSFYVQGALSKNSGSFRIDHPLESMTETHQLVHSFVEAPQADLYYRGKLKLVNGKGQANIDEIATMTEGTFEALCREVQCFTTNETGWDLVKGKVIGNIIYIESQNPNSTDEISWLVIGERQDKHMMDTDWTDDNGRVIVEPLKPIKKEEEKTEVSALENKS